MTQAGTYRRRVNIQKQVQAKDSTGSIVPTWKTIWADVPCSIAPYRGRESFAAQQPQSELTWKIAFRWRPGLDPTMRLVEYADDAHTSSTVYNIEAVMPDATNRREIGLLCRTRTAQGFKSDGV